MTRYDEHEMRVGFEGRDGVPGVSRKIEVEVPSGDVKPWDLDTKFVHVGGATDRVDAVAKVTGRAKYAYDMNLPGMLHGLMVRSPHAQGRLLALDLEPARAMPGVRAVIALKEVGNQVRFVGDPIAAIAADSLDEARDALRAIRADYRRDEDFAIDLRDGEGAPALDAAGEVTDPWPGGDGIDEALAGCATTLVQTFSAEVQTHSSLETHGLCAQVHPDGSLEAWASTQATFGVRQGLASGMDIPPEKVRVHAEYVGGGFGSKFGPDAEGLAAARLSQAAKAPVKMMCDRFEEHTVTGNRPSMIAQIRAGLDGEGRIKAWDFRSYGGPGFTGRGGSVSYTPSYFGRAVTRKRHRDIATATDPGRSMRAPGWPQGNFAAEAMIDALARQAGIDPLEFRLRNDEDELRQAEWRIAAERFGWAERVNPKPGRPRDGDDPRFLRGAGMASAFWGQMGRPGNAVTCRIHADGTVESRNGAQDMGTGMKTVMAILTAEELGITPEQVRVTMGHTDDPVGPGSGGSTTTPSLAPTVRHAAWLAKQELCQRVADQLGLEVAQVRCEGGRVIAGERTLSFRDACKTIGPNPIQATGRRFPNYDGYKDNVCGCQFAEVLVDSRTGLVRVTKMLAVQDCGVVIAGKLAESQVIGAMIQGISYALHEQRIMERRTGRMVNGDMAFYKFTGPADMPAEMEAIMLSVHNGKNNVGAAGLGEPPAVAAPAAVANAVANAVGVTMRSLPITPDKVLNALASREAK
jgi:xanthine dehydrogenase YagR molybdenum-binding subunit